MAEGPGPAAGDVTFHRDGGIGWLRFTHPHRLNLITQSMLAAIRSTALELADSAEIDALVVTGRPDMFSGGGDLNELGGRDFEANAEYIRIEHDAIDFVEKLPFITVAAIAGACVANAAEMSLACDFRVVTDDVRWGLVEVHAGAMGPAHRISRYLGIGRAKELVYSGRILGSAEMLELGLANRVVPAGSLEAETRKFIETFTAPPSAIRLAKANFYQVPEPAERVRALNGCGTRAYQDAIESLLRKPPGRESQ
ncbi:MAG TPA: enoyl-CoA hydratase/isomerase family protein [Streptosporangiaceae bacterium]|jgi:enoyl-CoA hydratase/carnithine racemase